MISKKKYKTHLTKEQVEDLLINVIEVTEIKSWKGDKIQFTCPIHNESTPSCGINIDFRPPNEPFTSYQVFNCFSCHAGGTIPWLLYQARKDKFKSLKHANEFLQRKYQVTFEYTSSDGKEISIIRYEDETIEEETNVQKVKSKVQLALFKSGIETYQYFFDRGFTKEDMKEYLIGRDLKEETVTMPIFFEDNTLAGFIGRYVDNNRPKNKRFKVYDFTKSNLIYPLNKLQVSKEHTLIGVESIFDCIILRKWGYTNAIALFTNSMSRVQAEIIKSKCKKFIALFDNDERGQEAHTISKKLLGKDVIYLTPSYFPEQGTDPLEWGELETIKVINSAKILGDKVKNIRRIY